MAYLLALSSAALYGTADFLCGLASRRANTLVIVVTSQGCGLTLLVLSLPLLPAATRRVGPTWFGCAGQTDSAVRPAPTRRRSQCAAGCSRVLTPLYVKTLVQAAKSAAWRAR